MAVTDWVHPTVAVTGQDWSGATSITEDDTANGFPGGDGQFNDFHTFMDAAEVNSLLDLLPADLVSIDGVEIRSRAFDVFGDGGPYVNFLLSTDGGTTFTTEAPTEARNPVAPTTFPAAAAQFISGGATALFGRTFVRADLSDANFYVRAVARADDPYPEDTRMEFFEVRWHFTPAGGAPSYVDGAATGDFSLVGTAAGTRVKQAAAAGTLGVTGTSSGQKVSDGDAAGSFGFDGSASGQIAGGVVDGAGAGTFSFSGSAVGVITRLSSGLGSVIFSGSATASLIKIGGAAGSYSFSGQSAAIRLRNAASPGVIGFLGAANAGLVSPAAAAGQFSFSGLATAQQAGVADAQAIGSFSLSGVANAARTLAAQALGTMSWEGTAVSGQQNTELGQAVGSYSFVGTAAAEFDSQALDLSPRLRIKVSQRKLRVRVVGYDNERST